MKKRNIVGRFQAPSWSLPLFMAVFCEIMLYLWTMEEFVFHRFAAILLFSVGLGCVLALICSLFPKKASKWVAGILSFLMVVLTVTEYLIDSVFHYFMASETIAAGAGGVLSDYMSIVWDAIFSHLPHILLLLLPIIAFLVLVRPAKTRWVSSCALLVVAALLYGSGVVMVNSVGEDSHRFKESYNFDSAVRCFGVHMGFVLDVWNNSAIGADALEFEAVQTLPSTEPGTEATTEATEPSESDPTDPEETEEPTEEVTEPPVVYTEAVLDIDFAALAESESNGNIRSIHSYVASVEPSMTNEYTGLFAGKNLIFITAEAFTGAFISEELTPTLYRLATQGIEFTDYYQPAWGAGTTGGEYSNVVGLIPKGGSCMAEASTQKLFFTIGNQLQQLGYSSAAYHNNSYTYYSRHKTHTYLGYDYFMGWGNGMEKGISSGWPQSDLEMIDYTVDMYIDQQPFSVYYMSVSGHSVYTKENDMAAKNYDKVADLDYSEAVKCYIASQLELEAALTSLLNHLEEAGIMDDTVIVISADHYPYGLDTTGDKYLKELFGTDTMTDVIRDQNCLIIWSGCIEDMDIVVDDPVMSLDILPTLSNLFGVEWDSRLLPGRDVFSDTMPLVYWGLSGSWKTDLGTYNASKKTFIPNEGVEVDQEYVDAVAAIIKNKVKYCRAVADYNYFNYVYEALYGEE